MQETEWAIPVILAAVLQDAEKAAIATNGDIEEADLRVFQGGGLRWPDVETRDDSEPIYGEDSASGYGGMSRRSVAIR